ncbi:hypothetical protein T02_2773 [Trichinella nativa]|uniref:Uncharacterized protein n=1 Tax=Trichinella nativa TaxID=6335 RepID=A0A0V1L1N8_9BILA|nr:hypothetical protein T02_2773 [Trichinella nativa]
MVGSFMTAQFKSILSSFYELHLFGLFEKVTVDFLFHMWQQNGQKKNDQMDNHKNQMIIKICLGS